MNIIRIFSFLGIFNIIIEKIKVIGIKPCTFVFNDFTTDEEIEKNILSKYDEQ